MKGKDVICIAEKIFNKFPYKIEKPVFKIMKKIDFAKYLNNSALKANLKKTPAFVAHLPDGELIVFCEEIISTLTSKFDKKKKRKFIEAITIHELFHIWNNRKCISSKEALLSEEEVHKEISQEFPELNSILEEFKK